MTFLLLLYTCHQVTGVPAMAVFCHCTSCRVYAGGAGNVAAFPVEQLTYTKGQDNLILYEQVPGKQRMSCKTCGSWVQNTLPPNNLQIIPLASLNVVSGPVLKPTMHIWVGDRGDMDLPTDGLPQHDGWPA